MTHPLLDFRRDLAMEKHLVTLRGHTDYVRCAAQTDINHTWLSGSYDKTIKMWDVRSKACSLSFNQGTAVHALVAGGGTEGCFVAAGDNRIRVWDSRKSGGEDGVVAMFSSHQKQITSLAWALGGKRLLSSSLDQHVKVRHFEK